MVTLTDTHTHTQIFTSLPEVIIFPCQQIERRRRQRKGGRTDKIKEQRTKEGDILPMSHNLDLMKIH